MIPDADIGVGHVVDPAQSLRSRPRGEAMGKYHCDETLRTWKDRAGTGDLLIGVQRCVSFAYAAHRQWSAIESLRLRSRSIQAFDAVEHGALAEGVGPPRMFRRTVASP